MSHCRARRGKGQGSEGRARARCDTRTQDEVADRGRVVRPRSGRQGRPFMLRPINSRPSRLVPFQETTVETKHHRSRIARIVAVVGLTLVLAGSMAIDFPPISSTGACAQAPTTVCSAIDGSGWVGERPVLGVSKFPQITL